MERAASLRRWLRERLHLWQRTGEPLDPEALDACLRELGLPEDEMETARSGGEEDIRRMLARFGIDPEEVPPRFLAALRDAERVCAHCLAVRRCHRFLAAAEPRDSARLFCPNAALFDEIARALGEEGRPAASDPDM